MLAEIALSLLMASPLGAAAAPGLPLGNSDPSIDSGEVVLDCRVLRDGRLEDCRVVRETPQGAGFARQALRGAQGARLNPRQSRRGRVTFTTRFRLVD